MTRRLLFVPLLALASGLALGLPHDAEASTTTLTAPLKITTVSVGPTRLGMSAGQGLATGMYRRATSSERSVCGLGARFKYPWSSGMNGDIGAYWHLKTIDIHSGKLARTSGGIHVGSTVAQLKAAHSGVSGPVRGPDYVGGAAYYLGAAGHWMSFIVGDAGDAAGPVPSTAKITEIFVSTVKQEPTMPHTGC